MAEQLTTEQILLLNNLMYIPDKEPFQTVAFSQNKKIEDYLDEIRVADIENNKDYGSFMTGKDWKNIIHAIEQDPQLMNMQIAETHTDDGSTGGGGKSAVFVNPETREAVVAFRGTSDVGRILRTFKIKKNVEVTDNGKIII